MDNIFGEITTPANIKTDLTDLDNVPLLLDAFVKLLIIGAGIFALFNFILAGYSFISAGNDPQKIQNAWAKIWQSIIGLVFTAGAFVIAAIIGKLVFDDFDALLQFGVYGIGDGNQ